MSCEFLRGQIPPEAKTALRDLNGMQMATDRMANLVKNLLDAESIGFGASGRNGGIVSPAFACGNEAIAARVGPEKARALHRLSIEGVARLRSHIDALNIIDAQLTPGLLHLRRQG